jgi:hypothetical protein
LLSANVIAVSPYRSGSSETGELYGIDDPQYALKQHICSPLD